MTHSRRLASELEGGQHGFEGHQPDPGRRALTDSLGGSGRAGAAPPMLAHAPAGTGGAIAVDDSFAASLGAVQAKAQPASPGDDRKPAQGVRPAKGINLAFFFTGGDAFGKNALAYIEAYYPDHIRCEARSFEHMFEQVGTEVARAMREARNERGHVDEIVIISHANAAGGMKIPLTDERGSKKFNPGELNKLQEETNERGLHKGFMAKRDAAMPAIDEDTQITIRGCEVGKSPEALDALRVMFGGDATVIAPTEFQGFQVDQVGAGQRLETWDQAHDMLVRNGYLNPTDLAELTPVETARITGGPDEILRARKAKYTRKRFPKGVPTEFFVVGEENYKTYKAMTRREKLGNESERVKVRQEDEETVFPNDRNPPWVVSQSDTEEHDGRDTHWAKSEGRRENLGALSKMPHDQVIAEAEALVADWRPGHGAKFLRLHDVWQLPDVEPQPNSSGSHDLKVDSKNAVRKTPSVFGPENMERALVDAYKRPDRARDAWRSEDMDFVTEDNKALHEYRTEGLELDEPESKEESTDNGVETSGDDRLILWGFLSNGAKMTAAHDAALDAFVATLGSDDLITIDGHSDRLGTLDANLRLSRDRAENVGAALKRRGVTKERLVVSGKGPATPRVDDTVGDRLQQRAARAENRRVEILRTPGWMRPGR